MSHLRCHSRLGEDDSLGAGGRSFGCRRLATRCAIAHRISAELVTSPPVGIAEEDVAEAKELLTWLATTTSHSWATASMCWRTIQTAAMPRVTSINGPQESFAGLHPPKVIGAHVAASPGEGARADLVHEGESPIDSSIVRAYLDYVGVKSFDAAGRVVGERRFCRLLSATTYADSATEIPVIRQTIAKAIELSQYPPGSHHARDLLHFCETYPRDELFQVSPEQLIGLGRQVLAIGERRQTRVFVRNDDYGRFASILVYLPRDRYDRRA